MMIFILFFKKTLGFLILTLLRESSFLKKRKKNMMVVLRVLDILEGLKNGKIFLTF